jgi:uncharacterized protein (TIGR00369 family)
VYAYRTGRSWYAVLSMMPAASSSLRWRSPVPRASRLAASRGFVVWNLLGSLDLIVAVGAGTLIAWFGIGGDPESMSPMAQLPFVRHMGMRITDLAWGEATFEMTASEFRLQPLGVVHGGNLATLIDSATFWACYLSMGSDDDGLASVDLKLNYLAPARVETLRSTGRLIKAGKTLSYAEADVRTGDGRLVAHGTSTVMRLPGMGVKLGIPLWVK